MKADNKLIIANMTCDHIINRIAWAKRQMVDPYNVIGDHYEFSFTATQIEEQNKKIEKHIKELEKELSKRRSI